MDSAASSVAEIPAHHVKHAYCENRENYRKGKRLTAVKVYTVNDESKYIIISRIQAIKLDSELLKLVSAQGPIQIFRKLDDYPSEAFEEAYLVQYTNIQAAKKAKRQLDEKDFFGSMLHVFYAPEYETPEEVVDKLKERSRSVVNRIKFLQNAAHRMEKKQQSAKKMSKKMLQQQQRQQVASSTTAQIQGRWQGSYQADLVLPNNAATKLEAAGTSSAFPSSSHWSQQGRGMKRAKMSVHKSDQRPRLNYSSSPSTPFANPTMTNSSVTAFVPRTVNLKSSAQSSKQQF